MVRRHVTLPSGMLLQPYSTFAHNPALPNSYRFVKECVYIQINLFYLCEILSLSNMHDELMRQIGVIIRHKRIS